MPARSGDLPDGVGWGRSRASLLAAILALAVFAAILAGLAGVGLDGQGVGNRRGSRRQKSGTIRRLDLVISRLRRLVLDLGIQSVRRVSRIVIERDLLARRIK